MWNKDKINGCFDCILVYKDKTKYNKVLAKYNDGLFTFDVKGKTKMLKINNKNVISYLAISYSSLVEEVI